MTLGVQLPSRAIGAPLDRIDGPLKVTGAARYAYEYPVAGVTYVFPIQSTIAKGRVVSIDARAARALPGVVAVLSHEDAPRLHRVDIRVIGQRDQDLAVFQSDVVTYRGQVVAAVVAETLEVARQAASLATVRYEEQPHDVELRADRGDLYAPETLVQGTETDTTQGDIAAALAAAPVSTDRTYTTPAEHNNPLEPHATVAVWGGDGQSVTLYDANQGADWIRAEVAEAFGLTPEHVRVIAPYVGGGFGSKAFAHSHVILAVMAARAAGRPAKVRLTRPPRFALTGYAPSIDPEPGHPFSSRGLVACLREGAERFGWQPRNPRPGMRTDGRWLIGTGVAASTFPALQQPAAARVGVDQGGRYRVRIAASDIGTGAWTALTQIAADALAVPPGRVPPEIGDSALPQAGGAAGPAGARSLGG